VMSLSTVWMNNSPNTSIANQSQSQSYFATDGRSVIHSVSQSVSPSLRRAPFGAHDQMLICCQTTRDLVVMGICLLIRLSLSLCQEIHTATTSTHEVRVCQSQSHITTDIQSVRPSCFRAPSGTHDHAEAGLGLLAALICSTAFNSDSDRA